MDVPDPLYSGYQRGLSPNTEKERKNQPAQKQASQSAGAVSPQCTAAVCTADVKKSPFLTERGFLSLLSHHIGDEGVVELFRCGLEAGDKGLSLLTGGDQQLQPE